MNRMVKRALALPLAFAMLLSLAACKDSGDSGDSAEQLSGAVYVPEYIDMDLGKARMQESCTDGENVYILTATYPDWEAGETGDTVYNVQRISLESGEMTPLENFVPEASPEGYQQSYAYYSGIRAGADGTIWVEASVNGYSYDVPEDFDETKDEYWNYEIKDSLEADYQIQLDSTGAEITRFETTDMREKAGIEYVYSDGTYYSDDGDIFICDSGKIVVLDAGLNVLFTVEDENMWGGKLIQLSDGRVCVISSSYDTLNEQYSLRLRAVDKENKDWGDTIELPSISSGEVYSGSGDYLFYYQSGEVLYGYKAETAEGEDPVVRLLNWMDADMAVDDLNFFSFQEDGRLVVMARSWGGGMDSSDTVLAVLTPIDRSELPEKVTLTYATMYLGQAERNMIIQFNRSSTTHRIEVKDYAEFRTDDDYDAGVKKLNTEILAGQVPDIISTYSLPIRQYGAKGILEDLWPYIDSDSEIGGRDGLMERVFNAVEQDGKLYQIFEDFSMTTVIGAASVVGDRTSWTLADLQAAWDTMPEGCDLLSQSATKSSVLSSIVRTNLDSLVDWNTGECSFDSDAFKNMLAFCGNFADEYNWEDYQDEYDDEPTRITEGRQMLMIENIGNFSDIQMYKAIFGGSISFIGYPREDGSAGSAFSVSEGLAMSSTCKDKDAAWSFMRQLLTPKYAGKSMDDYWDVWNFPANKADFEGYAEYAMTPKGYETDEDGNRILDEDGNPIESSSSGWSWGSVSIDIVSTKQDEYDQIMALYNQIEDVASTDTNISEIVTDVAGSYFAGDRTLDDAAAQTQSRVKLYVDENR